MSRVQDPVLGSVVFSDEGLVADILKHEVFQRTRRLAQLGPAQLVFPTAHHTRFSHSLGVYELTRRVLGRLKTQSKNDLSQRLQDTVEIGALLHDVGHYPLSHCLEVAYPKPETEDGAIEDFGDPIPDEGQGALVNDLEGDWFPDPEADGGEDSTHLLQYASDLSGTKPLVHHEQLGRVVVEAEKWELPTTLGRTKYGRLKASEVGAVFTGDYSAPVWGASLSRLVKSQWDTDRLDYLLRDAQTIGSTYGVVEADILIDALVCGDHERHGRWVAFPEESLPAIDHFLFSRYFAYQGLVFHPTSCCFDVLARAAYLAMLKRHKWLPQNGKELYAMARGESADFTLLDWDDSLFWSLLKSTLHRCKDAEFVEKTISEWLLQRKHPVAVISMDMCVRTPEDENHYQATRDELRAAFLKACRGAKADRRLCFTNEARKSLYDAKERGWTAKKGLVQSDAILVKKRGEDVPMPLDVIKSSLVAAIADTKFAVFRGYVPAEKADLVRSRLPEAYRL